MNRNLIFWLIIAWVAGCKKPFSPPEIMIDHNFLVVEGTINGKPNSATIITLTRSRKLTDTVLTIPETNAQVFIEDGAGGNYFLLNNGNGIYKSDPLTLNAGGQFRLKINTGNGEQYVSDFVPLKLSPVIDSLTWKWDNDVTVYLNSHDPQNNTRFYRWEFVETWEYHPFFDTDLGYENGQIFTRDSSNQINKCWSEANSTGILLGSSIQLSEDIINQAHIAIIPKGSEKLAIKYSILVKQYGLTSQAFEYWQILKKNTEELGSLFDAQPSQLTGNIHNVKNPAELVIGYVSACVIEEKRIFIRRSEVPGWFWQGYDPFGPCPVILINPLQASDYLEGKPLWAPAYYATGGGGLAITHTNCVDCRTHGGKAVKPIFWQ